MAPPASDDDDVPRLPRGKGLKLRGPELFRVALTVMMLLTVVMLAKPCGNAVANFVMGFDKGSGSATGAGSATLVIPGSAGDYVELHPGMTDAEIKAAIDRARAIHAAGTGSAGSGVR